MCYEVKIHGKTIDNVGDLKKALKNIVYDKNYSQVDDKNCLCCIDFENTAKQNKLSCNLTIEKEIWILE